MLFSTPVAMETSLKKYNYMLFSTPVAMETIKDGRQTTFF